MRLMENCNVIVPAEAFKIWTLLFFSHSLCVCFWKRIHDVMMMNPHSSCQGTESRTSHSQETKRTLEDGMFLLLHPAKAGPCGESCLRDTQVEVSGIFHSNKKFHLKNSNLSFQEQCPDNSQTIFCGQFLLLHVDINSPFGNCWHRGLSVALSYLHIFFYLNKSK